MNFPDRAFINDLAKDYEFKDNIVEYLMNLKEFLPIGLVQSKRAVPILSGKFKYAITDSAKTFLENDFDENYILMYADHDDVEKALSIYPKLQIVSDCEEEIFKGVLNPSVETIQVFPKIFVSDLDACPISFSEKDGILLIASSHHRTKRRQKFLEGRIQKYSPCVKSVKFYVMPFTIEGREKLNKAQSEFYGHTGEMFGFSKKSFNKMMFGKEIIVSDPFYVEDVPPLGEYHEMHDDELNLDPEKRKQEREFYDELFKEVI